MAKKKNKRISTSEQTDGGLGSLGDLLAGQGFEPSGENEIVQEPAKESVELSSCSKIVVRKEKKGRGGKVVTAVDGINFLADDLELLAKKMRKSLGCGGGVEDSRIVLQGDIGERVRSWLKENGAKRVV